MKDFFKSSGSLKVDITFIIITLIPFVFCFFADDVGNALSLYATIFGLMQAAVIMIGRRESWIFYVGYTVAYTIMSIYFALWGDVIENGIYIIFGIIGLFLWYTKDQSKIRIRFLTNKQRVLFLLLMSIVASIVIAFLYKTNDPQPFLDGLTTGMGFVATILMTMKRVEAWVVWFVDDVLMVVTYWLIPEQPWAVMILNAIWALFAIGSLVVWYKMARDKVEVDELRGLARGV
ncbi:MAG: nicotinamide riboside transporter PnuC [Clostridiales bacterium]|jgi:nicotinamide mononucleotide transporter PnuC|nr:nicotinamide riboside transporter PnuC [Clostridiales bacterium]